MLKHLKNKKGFTLVELILSLILLLLVLSLGYLIFSVISGNFSTGTSQSFVQQNARFVDDFFKDNIRNIGQLYIGENQSTDMEFAVFLEDGIAKTNDRDITETIISDIRVKVDRSENMAVLQYIINGEEDGKTFEISNQLVLNNIPAEYLSADYDNYISLTDNKLSYNYEPIYLMNKVLTVYPPVITTGQTYTDEEPLELNLVISNDTFVTGISTIDFELLFPASINIIDVNIYKENDTLVILTLTGDTGSVEDVGEINILASGLAGEDNVSVVIPFENPEVAYVIIEGATKLKIPLESMSDTESTYNAKIYDQGGNEMTGQGFTWSVIGSPDGVMADITDSGPLILNVFSEAVAEEKAVTLLVTSDDNPDIDWSIDIDLEEVSLEDIMVAITTLPYKTGYDAYDNTTYIVEPSISGIVFSYIDPFGTGISVNASGEIVLARHQSQDRNGTITLHGVMETETYDVAFSIFLPSKKDDDFPIEIFPQ